MPDVQSIDLILHDSWPLTFSIFKRKMTKQTKMLLCCLITEVHELIKGRNWRLERIKFLKHPPGSTSRTELIFFFQFVAQYT